MVTSAYVMCWRDSAGTDGRDLSVDGRGREEEWESTVVDAMWFVS